MEVIVPGMELTTVVVRPLSQHIQPAIRGQALTFSIEKPCQLSIEPNGRWDSPLFVFANEPETDVPRDGDAQVIFLGPGIHTGDMVLRNGQTLYLAGGAILTGSINAEHVQDVTIRGRGIIDFYKPEFDKPDGFNEAAQRPGQRPLFFRDVAKAQVNGIIAVNGTRSWTTLSVDSRDLFFEDVKLIAGAWWNTDGFAFWHVDGATVRHCFLMTADDAFSFHAGQNQDNSNITIAQCVTFNVAANTVAVAWPGSTVNLHDVRISDMDLIHCSHQDWTWVNCGALRFSNLDQKQTRLENFAMEDIRIEDARTFCQLIWVGTCKNISFKNIDIHMADRRTTSTITAQQGGITGSIDGVTFENLRINDKPILSAKDGDIEIGPGVRNIRFLKSTGSPEPPLSLNEAAAMGNLDSVRSLVAKGANVNRKESGFQMTPLYRAVESGHREVVEYLLAQGADVSAKCDWHQETPLHRAVTLGGGTQMIELLLAKGADINATNGYGNTPVHVAVAAGHVAIVELLATKGADLNVKNNDGFAPLHYTVSSRPLSWWETQMGIGSGPKDLAIVQFLLAHGADVNAKSKDGRSPMDIASDENRTEVVELLLAKGAEVSIHTAARLGNVDKVRSYLEGGADVNAKDKDGDTLLHVAAWNKQKGIAELLISKGADVNAKDNRHYPPLFYALFSNDANMVGLLVAKGADVNFASEKDYPPLHYAVWFENLDMAKVLLDHGAKFDVKDQQGWTAFRYAASAGNGDLVDLFIAKGADVSSLSMAACAGNLARVKELVEQGAEVDAKDELSWTALYWAASMGREEVAAFLIDKGAKVGARTNDGQTALQQAAQAGVARLVELLISRGADVKAQDKNGKTPLHGVASSGCREVVELLLTKGADVNAKTTNDWTPLHMAAIGGHKDVVEVLLAKGADVNAKDKQGRTPADLAERRGHTEIAELLRKHGASLSEQARSLRKAVADHDIAQVKSLLLQGVDVNGQDETGDTPLHCAAKLTGDAGKDLCELLIARGASINARDRMGRTPLHEAVESGNVEVVKLVIADGADLNARDRDDRTPLSLADAAGGTEIVELLNKYIHIPSPAEASFADTAPNLILTPDTSIAPQQFGCYVACGDVNGDGYDDCLVTAAHYNNYQGKVYLYYGGPDMDARPDKVFPGEPGELFGEGVALGDVNGDHFADVIIAALRFNNKQGRVLIYYGGPDMDTKPDVILEGEPGTSGTFGRVIHAADVDRDGYADVVVNALRYGSEAGRAYLYYGGNPMSTVPAKIFDGENPGDMFGREMDMGGDVNGDGYGDIIFGCRAWNRGQGRAYLYYGGPKATMDTKCDKVFTGELVGDEFGSSVCLFDVDKDGYADVMIGARKYSKNTPRSFEGRMYLYWGGPALAPNADLTFEGEKSVGGCFGGDSIQCGYFNSDGYPDIAVSDWGYRTSQGRVCLYYGGPRASTDTVCDHTFTGETGTEACMYGVRIAVGDFNGDRRSDLLVGAPWYPSGNRLGRAYVYYTKPFPPGRHPKPAKLGPQVPGSNEASPK